MNLVIYNYFPIVIPGQYIDVIGKNGFRRSYSIANAPREDGTVTLQIRKVVGGQMSHYWFHEAKVNDLLRMEGPLGTFSLRKSNVSNLILLATGTGIAPIRAILEQILKVPNLNTFANIFLYWGGRAIKDLYFDPLEMEVPIIYRPVLSRDNVWDGHKGYVQQAVLADEVDLFDSVVYACGSENMIESSFEILTKSGLSQQNFYSDAFVSSG